MNKPMAYDKQQLSNKQPGADTQPRTHLKDKGECIMNKMRKIAAFTAALAMAATLAFPGMMMTANAASIEIKNISTAYPHTFEVYQVFTGRLEGGNLSELKWGNGVASYGGATVTEGNDVSAADVTTFEGLDEAGLRDMLKDGTLEFKNAVTDISTGASIKFEGLADGYYVVKDVTNLGNKDDANSAWIVQVADEASLNIKNAKPTVDKQILDETGDAEAGHTNGWGESADHDINETFQYKLIGTIPQDEELEKYDEYKLVFTDYLPEGVSFDGNVVVTVNGKTLNPDDFTASSISNGIWTVTIDDIIPLLPTGTTFGVNDITVEVVYDAHLNKDATPSSTNGTFDDSNGNAHPSYVELSYSNNPDGTSESTELGKTPKDYVWCFTYQIQNTKYAISTEGNPLPDAKFKLYAGTGDSKTEIGVIYDDTIGAYRPVAKTGETATEMISGSDGKFNIVGLDHGTYTIVETDAPEGYKEALDVVATINANHTENTEGTAVDLVFTKQENTNNQIVDTKVSTLPTTGGVGTTLFILGGGMTAAAAGIYLISKRRAKNETAG
jgi:fimbrial isopeptide formation D2 family protein/LPXTG-motif cell wall-anchored protein